MINIKIFLNISIIKSKKKPFGKSSIDNESDENLHVPSSNKSLCIHKKKLSNAKNTIDQVSNKKKEHEDITKT